MKSVMSHHCTTANNEFGFILMFIRSRHPCLCGNREGGGGHFL